MKVPIFPYLELNTNILGVKNWREKPWRDKKIRYCYTIWACCWPMSNKLVTKNPECVNTDIVCLEDVKNSGKKTRQNFSLALRRLLARTKQGIINR